MKAHVDEVMMTGEVRLIPLIDLIDPPFTLREVNQRCVEYAELKDSLAKLGFLNSICVRPSIREPGKYEVADGRYRTACAKELDLPHAPSIVKPELSDKDMLALQITANAARLATRPSEYAKQIRRILRSNVGMTQPELCQYLNKNPAWVRKMLGMARLTHRREYRQAIDRGELSLEAAYYLSKLPTRFWIEYVDDAKTMPLREFKALIMTALRQYRAQVRQGTLAGLLLNIEPRAYMRSLSDIQEEIDGNHIGALTIASEELTPLQAWFAALQWVIHLDKSSVERQRAKILRRMKKRIIKRDSTG